MDSSLARQLWGDLDGVPMSLPMSMPCQTRAEAEAEGTAALAALARPDLAYDKQWASVDKLSQINYWADFVDDLQRNVCELETDGEKQNSV